MSLNSVSTIIKFGLAGAIITIGAVSVVDLFSHNITPTAENISAIVGGVIAATLKAVHIV